MSAVKKETHLLVESEPSTEYNMNYRILIVEDDPQILQNYKEILTSSNVVPIRKSSRSTPTSDEAKSSTYFPFEVTLTKNAEEALVAIDASLKKGQPFAMGFFVLGSHCL